MGFYCDYSQSSAYFITICTKDSKCILSHIVEDTAVGATIGRPQVILTDFGQIVKSKIEKIQTVYYGVKVNKYVIKPNHIHLIIMIDIENGRPMVAPTVEQKITMEL